MKALLFILTSLSLLSQSAWGEDFFDAVPTESSTDSLNLDSPWSSRAWLQQKIGYGWHMPGMPASRDQAALTRTESQVFGEINWRHNSWRLQVSGALGQDWLPELATTELFSAYEFTGEQRRQRRWRLDMADTFVSWQAGDWWLKAGYQTLAWGESESLKITDVLARRDQRWPGQEDLEQLRLPVPAAQITWRNRLDAVVLIHPLPDRMPSAGDEFDPYATLRQQHPGLTLIEERETRPGFALRLRQQWPGLDAQWILADLASYETEPRPVTFAEQLTKIHLTPWRQQIAGVGAQWGKGSWLLRTEQALHNNSKVAASDPRAPWQKTRQWRGMIGADYTGINDLLLSAEYSWLYIDQWRSDLGMPGYQPALSGRIHYNLYNDRLSLEAYGQSISGGEGRLLRLMAEWIFSDHFSASITAVEYDGRQADDLLYPYRHNDALIMNLRWSL